MPVVACRPTYTRFRTAQGNPGTHLFHGDVSNLNLLMGFLCGGLGLEPPMLLQRNINLSALFAKDRIYQQKS
jgi:hypothetical protein